MMHLHCYKEPLQRTWLTRERVYQCHVGIPPSAPQWHPSKHIMPVCSGISPWISILPSATRPLSQDRTSNPNKREPPPRLPFIYKIMCMLSWSKNQQRACWEQQEQRKRPLQARDRNLFDLTFRHQPSDYGITLSLKMSADILSVFRSASELWDKCSTVNAHRKVTHCELFVHLWNQLLTMHIFTFKNKSWLRLILADLYII